MSILCDKCGNNDEKDEEEKLIDILKILVLINNKYEQYILPNEYVTTLKTNMVAEKSQEFRLRNIDDTINYFIEKIIQNY